MNTTTPDEPELPAIEAMEELSNEREPRVPKKRGGRKRRRNAWLILFWLSLLGTWAFYVFVLPHLLIVWQHWTRPGKLLPPNLQLDLYSRTTLRTLEFFAVSWFFFVGASIGSFLNVVAWRMPRGITIVRGGSKCPYCCSSLSRSDNLPILGWLRLKGRCRTCRLPIDARYVWVEVWTGMSFLWLAVRELLSGGVSLPIRPANLYSGVVWIIFYTKWDLVAIYAYHCTMVFSLMTFTLMARSPLLVPGRFLLFAFLVAFIPPFLFPDLQLVSWCDPWSIRLDYFPGDRRFLTSTLGGLSGILLSVCAMTGFGATLVGAGEERVNRQILWIFSGGLIGVYLGWQAILIVGLLWLVVFSVLRSTLRNRIDLTVLSLDTLVAVTVVHQGLWRFFYEWIYT